MRHAELKTLSTRCRRANARLWRDDAIYDYFGEHSGHPIIVIPTAGGKSIVLAAFIQEVMESWPDQRILIVSAS